MENITKFVDALRSKNAGPFRLTLDLIFKDKQSYYEVLNSGVITKNLISKLYHVPIQDIYELVWYKQGRAVKITIKRPRSIGSMGETDVYGCQQHAPLLDIEIPEK